MGFDFWKENQYFKILDFIHKKKVNKACNKIIIYTNNQGAKSWVKMISDYFDKKLGYSVFDNIIAAYKINGKQIEMCRTTHDKTHKDLIRCTKIPLNAEICYLDDVYYPEMSHKNVYYINIKPPVKRRVLWVFNQLRWVCPTRIIAVTRFSVVSFTLGGLTFLVSVFVNYINNTKICIFFK